ncbi:MAG: MerR family transcriptional regulator [Hyphomicrobiales bacterium]|nr:MerR family transcriptional regulator [Rhodobiaceae bacterium]RZO31758.1 MAG: MerR family transcriptional regulator [Hyphomicrobiales bacterium]
MMNQKAKEAFKTISEVSGELNIPQHVLRFWEKKFKQIKPMTRGGGRRLYRPEDVELLRAIHKLLYTEMYTISGVQKIFRERGKNFILEHDESRKNLKSLPQVQQDASQESNYTADLFNNKNSSETDSDFNNFLIDSISELESLKEILQRSNT